jgi:hypothetical protein
MYSWFLNSTMTVRLSLIPEAATRFRVCRRMETKGLRFWTSHQHQRSRVTQFKETGKGEAGGLTW